MKFIGTSGTDNIVGTSGDDYIDGGAGEDWLNGGQGNDIIYSLGDITPDHIDGGDGTDTAVILREYLKFPYYSLNDGLLTLDLSSNQTQTAYMPDGTTIIHVEQLQFFGGNEMDVVTGGIGSNILDGGGGDDVLTGGNQTDQLDGGDGFDALMGRGGADTLYSFDNQGPDNIDGGAGTDLAWINRTSYFAGNLKLDLTKSGGQDIGDGTILNNIEKVYFWGGRGDDTLTGGALDDQLNGGFGSDHLDGGKGDDVINGDDGNDYIYSRANEGFDAIDGGAGNADFLMLDRSTSGANLYVDLSDPTIKRDIGDHLLWNLNGPPIQLPGTMIVNVEQVEFHGGSGQDVVFGGALKDLLFGNAGNDQLFGGGGDDFLDGGTGLDVLNGGPGNDTMYSADDGIRDQIDGGAGTADFAIIDRTSYSSALTLDLSDPSVFQELNDITTIIGVERINFLSGSGNDHLTGGALDDTLSGGKGDDVMAGLGGNDNYVVDSAGDVVNEIVGGGNDTVYAVVSYALKLSSEIETLSAYNTFDTTPINLTGNDFNNTLIGDAGDNVLNGLGGNDTMNGGTGNDTYYVDSAGDIVNEAVILGSHDTVLAHVTYSLKAGSQVEFLSTDNSAGSDPINLYGNEFGNVITGNAGSNIINGGSGNDTLTGLGGSDFYLFNTAINGFQNVDWLSDFSIADDKIELDHSIFSALAAGALADSAFYVGPAAHDANDHIIYDSSTGALYYDVNGNGAGGATEFAIVAANLPLTPTQFLVV